MPENKLCSGETEVILLSVSPISPHNKELLKLGSKIANESIAVGRDFCKVMVSVTLGGVPVYIGLLKFVLGTRHLGSGTEAIMAILPAVFFLVSAILFIIGHLPRVSELRLDIPAEIEHQKRQIINRRMKFAWLGVVVLSMGIIFGIVYLGIFLFR